LWGVIISDTWVLTAAHCVDGTEDPDWFVITAGAHNLNLDTEPNRRRIPYKRVIVHPGYDFFDIDNDIALIETESLGLNQFRHAACKPSPESDTDYTGQVSIVSGWGTTSSGGSRAPELYWVDVPVISNAECNTHPDFQGDITDGMVCAGLMQDNDKDSCQGDSGGPLVVRNTAGKYEVVGLVSWGYGCAGASPGVYARVPHYLDWIDQTIGSSV